MVNIDFNKAYRVKSFQGVACRIVGYPQRLEYNDFADEGGDWEDDVDCGDVLVCMVGDDANHRVPLSSCEVINDLDYCGVCGQIGCSHDGRDRS